MGNIHFLLNNEWETIRCINPSTSVLEYLRNHLSLTGTKEGCASGDCGACTVVLAELKNNCLEYKAINSCITPVATLHGKQLITVEHLKHEGNLHPVQESMVECHGSQCGFCTPGFIMSMFAHRKNHSETTREGVIEALGGNLCRCTGYRPIIDASLKSFESSLSDQFSMSEAATIEKLKSVSDQDINLDYQHGDTRKQFFAPVSLASLAEIMLSYPEARLVCGGTDLWLEFTQFLKEIDVLVYTGRVKELLEVRETSAMLDVGAAVTYNDCKDMLIDMYPDLHELIERLGSRQIRNQGTVGGNIGNASPIADMPPVLIALGADLVLRKGEKTRTIGIAEYYISYKVTALESGEFIERIQIPKPQSNYDFRVYKISKRLEDDISAVCAAINIKVEDGLVSDVRLAFGGMAAVPKRAGAAEKALLNKPFDRKSIEAAQRALVNDFSPLTDFRASAEYRLQVSQNLLERLFLELRAEALPRSGVRVTHYA